MTSFQRQKDTEYTIFLTRKHSIVWIKALFQVCGVLALTYYLNTLDTLQWPLIHTLPLKTVFIWIALIWGACVLIKVVVQYLGNQICLSNLRIRLTEGLILKRSTEMLLLRVERIQIEQSLLGRCFGYGSIHVLGSSGYSLVLSDMPQPDQLNQALQAALMNIDTI
ncbi:MAG: hypothetical protein CMF51_02195 [Legionellales bacterium]|nr:hypothetical protein [Legionellales bacterium]